MTRVRVLYFASLRDAAGRNEEDVQTGAPDLSSLYAELQSRHQLPFPQRQLRVAVDGDFVPWTTPLCEGSDVAFLPPVSGG
jgi:molybdopterin synthase sulfur carrier subunit